MFIDNRFRVPRLALIGLLFLAVRPSPVRAHCDALDGPVVKAATVALEKGDVTPVLMWVQADSEAEVRQAFQKTLAVRSGGKEARDLADRYFLETVVRLHRASEGEGYTGLKPAGLDFGPAVSAADSALESDSVDAVVALIAERSADGIRTRFARVLAARKHAGENVEAGRAYVAAYVDFIHYVERLYESARVPAGPNHHGHD